jgi:chromosome segregation ATPase
MSEEARIITNLEKTVLGMRDRLKSHMRKLTEREHEVKRQTQINLDLERQIGDLTLRLRNHLSTVPHPEVEKMLRQQVQNLQHQNAQLKTEADQWDQHDAERGDILVDMVEKGTQQKAEIDRLKAEIQEQDGRIYQFELLLADQRRNLELKNTEIVKGRETIHLANATLREKEQLLGERDYRLGMQAKTIVDLRAKVKELTYSGVDKKLRQDLEDAKVKITSQQNQIERQLVTMNQQSTELDERRASVAFFRNREPEINKLKNELIKAKNFAAQIDDARLGAEQRAERQRVEIGKLIQSRDALRANNEEALRAAGSRVSSIIADRDLLVKAHTESLEQYRNVSGYWRDKLEKLWSQIALHRASENNSLKVLDKVMGETRP